MVVVGNYETHDEFGNLAKSFNTMAEKLQEYSDSSLSKLMMEKKRIETLINNMHDPIIGLDSQDVILFVNNEALKIIGLKQEDVIGKSATSLALKNDLIRTLLSDKNSTQKSSPIKIFADGKESYFEKEIDEREIKEAFNLELIKTILSDVSIFTDNEIVKLSNLQIKIVSLNYF